MKPIILILLVLMVSLGGCGKSQPLSVTRNPLPMGPDYDTGPAVGPKESPPPLNPSSPNPAGSSANAPTGGSSATPPPPVSHPNDCSKTAGSYSILDVFADNTLNPFTSGESIAAFLQGLTIAPYIPEANNRKDAIAYLKSIKPKLDIDGSGVVDKFDGDMVMGYLFDLSPEQLIVKSGPGAKHNMNQVMTVLNTLRNTKLSCVVK